MKKIFLHGVCECVRLRKTCRLACLLAMALLCAIHAVPVNAATPDPKVTLNLKDVPLKVVFDEIQKQTSFSFVFSTDQTKGIASQTIRARNESVESVLQKVLANTGLVAEFQGNLILVRPRVQQPAPERRTIQGVVVNAHGDPLPYASVLVEGTSYGIATDDNGKYQITAPLGRSARLRVSLLGFETKTVEIGDRNTLNIELMENTEELDAVNVLTTGYYSVSQERATGSFTKISNKEFNYSQSLDFLSRLDGLTTDVLFNDKQGTETGHGLKNMTIRGPSTRDERNGRAPLIVLNDMIYNGDINNINPNDIENIVILKDAAAASVWGVNSGNGVIVITTKKSRYGKPMRIETGVNVSITDEPAIDYYPALKSSDFIDLEKRLFAMGYYDDDISNIWDPLPILSPVVDLLAKQRNGTLSEAEVTRMIDEMRNYSFEKQLLKYIYRPRVNQQYSIGISGGDAGVGYRVSAGFDNNRDDKINNSFKRFSFNSIVSFKATKNLEITSNIMYSYLMNDQNTDLISYYSQVSETRSVYYPYARLADENGNPLPLPRTSTIEWARQAGEERGLDWTYYPLNDINDYSFKTTSSDVLLNTSAKYTILPYLNVQVSYQFNNSVSRQRKLEKADAYTIRHDINRFTNLDLDQTHTHYRPIPLGGRLETSDTDHQAHTFRGQANFNKVWGGKHSVAAILGGEVAHENTSSIQPLPRYGYDSELRSSINVDFLNGYLVWPYAQYGITSTLPGVSDETYRTFRSTSAYTNASYTYDNRYTVSLSARVDAANIFGIEHRNKMSPLWSSGFSWNIANESFYNIDWMSFLKLRMTYGICGNIPRDRSAYLTLRHRTDGEINYALITNLPNPDLGWEKVKLFNIGVDFSLLNSRLSGSIEYFRKNSVDIYSYIPIDPTKGRDFDYSNKSSFKGRGIDVSLDSRILDVNNFRWDAGFRLTYNRNTTTRYDHTYGEDNPYTLVTGVGAEGKIGVIEGYDAYPIFSLRFAGLDPENGNPMGYDADGNVSSLYTYNSPLIRPATVDALEYHGSGMPRLYGSLRNTFGFKGFELSANITFKANYYFRRSTVRYSGIGSWNIHESYLDRWQSAGDEKWTTIPSMPATYSELTSTATTYRDQFYAASSANVAKGDHIRLQSIMMSYNLNWGKSRGNTFRIIANVSNLGILWRSNDWGIDPDLGSNAYPMPKIYTIGINATF